MTVNSFDEWSPLKEIIVGSPINFNFNNVELSFKIFFHDNAATKFDFCYPSYDKNSDESIGFNPQLKKQYLDELAEDIGGLVQTLEKLDIRVFRPMPLNESIDFKTPYWQSTCIPALNIRDMAGIFGNEIIETAPQIRSRYFENDLLKQVFYNYFKAGSKWTAMPKPIMTDCSFDLSYMRQSGQDMIATEKIYKQEPSEFDIGYEMMFDAAQCIRFGKDILVNVATENHELGLQWLEQHLSDFRFHRIYRMTDSHIDSIVSRYAPEHCFLEHRNSTTCFPLR
jgi:glycine amidinotransferase